MRHVIMAIGLVLLASACSKKDINDDITGSTMQPATPVVKDSLPAVNFPNVNYGPADQQQMDVYLPAGRDATTRTIVIIHGGGWTSGDKSDFNGYVAEFQKKLPGYAIVNMNYRLIKYDLTYFPMEEGDVISAMQFLKDKSADYHISQDVILLGSSAGAHMALLQGYKHGDVVKPKGIISFFGPTDLADLSIHFNDATIPWVLQKILGGALQEDPEAYLEASPINYANASSPPTLMLHGDADPLVPVKQAYALRDKLESLNVVNKLVVYPGQGHGWGGADLTDSFNQVEAFIKGL